MEHYIDLFSRIAGSLGGLGFFIGVLIAYKTGLLEFLLAWKKNGGNGKELKELKTQIGELEENHLEHINNKLDRIVELLIEIKTKVYEK